MRLLGVVIVIVVLGLGLGYYFGQMDSVPPPKTKVTDQKPVEKQAPSKTQSADALMGLWRSIEDQKFTREFTGDMVIDRYAGSPDATMEASWSFMSYGDDTGPIRIRTDRNYIKVVTPEEVMYFSIDSVSATELQLTYADGGEVQRFTKVR